jgi:hypothetical protein
MHNQSMASIDFTATSPRILLPPRGPRLDVSRRDRAILDLAIRKLGGGQSDFGEVVRALREATEELIVNGRIYFLGAGANGPIIGSIVSRVGIVGHDDRVAVVRVSQDGRPTTLGRIAP